MEKLFYPDSIGIYGLSSKVENIPRLILENLIRWGYGGRIFGIHPSGEELHVNGIKMYRRVEELPDVPDLVVALIPARFVPSVIEECGKAGVSWMAIPSGGFNEFGEEGKKLAEQAMANAQKYGVRFMGPNALTVANTANGLCIPFVPSYSPPQGGFSLITQSGGVGLMLWNLMSDENVGLAKFASIGNKLDVDEVEILEYFGRDPETRVIGMYLESIPRGRELIEAASRINKPVIILKANTSEAGRRAAMSHTAALSNNDSIVSSGFERAGIIRIFNYADFISVAKAFEMPPMMGNRIMVMSPAGGFTVMMADFCEKNGFEFADPGQEFYEGLQKFSNAGVIKFSNPLDMGDIYDIDMYKHIFFSVMHNEEVDGAIFVSQWPHMPKGDDVFYRMFHTDLSNEAIGSILSSGKPMGTCLFGLSKTISMIKQSLNMPIFNTPEEMITALRRQKDFYAHKSRCGDEIRIPTGINDRAAESWIQERSGNIGEEALELLGLYGIPTAPSCTAVTADEAVIAAERLGYPVVMKVMSPEALHKSDAGGVIVGIKDEAETTAAYNTIRDNLSRYNGKARFEGVRIMQMAGDGYDMFIGGNYDESFGPVAFFGLGGIYIEVFRDVQNILCPSCQEEIMEKLKGLKSHAILQGTRGRSAGNIPAYVDLIERVSHLLARFPQIREMDLNPVRVLSDGSGVIVLDARIRIEQ
ncbi:MAG: hypothetical protein CVV44_15620 [Spirochaetae bacterium HGW-Spirochaetae-1]|jgi:acetyltransferase|nr:MAG: hypothetical protein CVV44_15620 [Spirochaetae bacterium HGW-Spirochaetae-1]